MRMIDLFAGIGGFSLAAKIVWPNIHIIQVEKDNFCLKVLRKNFPNDERHEDAKTFRPTTANIVTAGFPCQPFSIAGKRRGSEDNRNLWKETARIIQKARPQWIVLENVPGIINMALDQVLSDLENLEYTWEAFIIPACALNACHIRERIWVIAYTNSIRRNSSQIKPEILEKALQEKSKCKLGRTMGIPHLNSNFSRYDRNNDGVPRKLEQNRIRALGNSIVPQIAIVIFTAINEIMKANHQRRPHELAKI